MPFCIRGLLFILVVTISAEICPVRVAGQIVGPTSAPAVYAERRARECVSSRVMSSLRTYNRLPDDDFKDCLEPLASMLQSEGKTKGEAISYAGWVAESETAKPFGIPGKPYKYDREFIERIDRESPK